MVETISPVVHGGRNQRYWLAWGLHAIAASGAAAATGALLGSVGSLLGAPWGVIGAGLVIAVAIAYAARDLFGLPVPLPDLKKQVPEWWRTFFSAPVTSTLYGVGLGTAFYTSLRFGTYVVVAAGVLALGNPLMGAAICAPFGLGRALVIAAANLEAPTGDEEGRLVGWANGAASILVGVVYLLRIAA